MNEHSSRSHAIFTITIECSEKGVDGNQHVRMGKLHLVDLAVCTLILILGVCTICTIFLQSMIYLTAIN